MEQEILNKIKAQEEYCEKKKYPLFAPSDGICFSCNRQIYTEITLMECENDLITGCPFCHYSYCD